MMKKVICMVLTLVMVLGLVACSSSGTEAETAAEATEKPVAETTQAETPEATTEEKTTDEVQFEEMKVDLGVSGNDSSPFGQGLLKMVDYIDKATDGKVIVTIHWSNSLFPQDQMASALVNGDLDMANFSPGFITDYMPSLAMFGSAYLFGSYEHSQAFYQSELAQGMFDELAGVGMRVLGSMYVGSRTINLVEDKKITCREDLADVKLRMPNSDVWMFMGEALGGNVIPLAYSDLYLGLQTGTVDGQDNPLSAIHEISLQEVTTSVTKTSHMYQYEWITINEDLWKSMSSELQQVFNDGMDVCLDYANSQYLQHEEDLVGWYEESGGTVYFLTDEESAHYREQVLEYYFDHPDKIADWDMDLYDAIQELEY